MWDKIWGYINKVISMGRRLDDAEEVMDKLSEDAHENRRKDELRDEKMNAVAQALQQFAIVYENDRKNTENEREMQRLRLENLLLQATQRLAPGQMPPDPEKEELRAIVEELKREVKDLTKRLEPPEQK